MNRHISRVIASLLALSAVGGLVSCGGTTAQTNDTTAAPSGETTVPEEAGYDFEGRDYGGYEFKVLNFESIWNCVVQLDFAEQTGETLNDAIYNRNRLIEEKLNFKLKEDKVPYASYNTSQIELVDRIIQSVMAGDYAYDAAYLPVNFKASVITDGYLLDMNTMPGLRLEEEWWDRIVNDSVTINGHLYCASSPLNLMTLDLSWGLLFNQNILDNYKLEYPYQLVRDGKWTLDKFNEYVATCTALNGDESFTFNENGKSIYGVAGHANSPTSFSYAAGNRLMRRDGDKFIFGYDNERTYNTLENLAANCTTSDGHFLYNNDNTMPSGYVNLFRSGRAAFATVELKTALEERDMKDTFGLIPMPKLDEDQDSYYSYMGANACFLTVPKTQQDAGRTGKILDALTYESWKSVLPVYYDVTVSQKGLRNEESIEMLDIIRSARGTEFSAILGITTSFATSIDNKITAGSSDFASFIASNKDSIAANLQKVLDVMQ